MVLISQDINKIYSYSMDRNSKMMCGDLCQADDATLHTIIKIKNKLKALEG